MTDQPAPGTIPLSPALAEASPDSLSDLFSRDPERLGRQDISRLIEALRAQRERCEMAEASGKGVPRAKKPKALSSPVNASDLGV